MKIRLNKFIANAGVCSRRKADELIEGGKIIVNGQSAAIGTKIDPDIDKVTYQGQDIKADEAKLVYYLINKPVGYTSTTADPHAKKTVIELVPTEPRVYPVGRLDKNSEGLMLLTNDGELSNRLTHPKFEHEKEYYIEAVIRRGKKTHESLLFRLDKLKKGIRLKEFKARGAKITNIEYVEPELAKFHIIIKEGHKRQIRRMCDRIGLEVIKLQRVRIGKLTLDDLEIGKYKEISRTEII